MDAVVAAEGAAAFGDDFEIAPATEGKVVGAERQGLSCGAASRECAGEHAGLRIGCGERVGDDELGSFEVVMSG